MKNNQKRNIRIHTYRKHVNLTLPSDLVEASKQQGLNLSRILEMELEKRLNGSVVAGPSGFEPEPQAPQACVLSGCLAHYPG